MIRAERREPRERKMWVLDRTNRTPTKCLLSKYPKAQIPPFLPKQPWLCLFSSYHLFSRPVMVSAPLCDAFERHPDLKRWMLGFAVVERRPSAATGRRLAPRLFKATRWPEKEPVKRSRRSLTAASWAPARFVGSLSHCASVALTGGCHNTLGLGWLRGFI